MWLRIRGCGEWQEFDAFYRWSLRHGYRVGRALLLADGATQHSPTTSRWGARPPRRNRRPSSVPPAGSALVRAFGESKTVAAWLDDPRCVVGEWTLRRRLGEGVPAETALTAAPRSGHPALPRARRPAIAKKVYAVTHWPTALRLRRAGVSMPEIARRLGVPYTTIQVGLYQRLGPAKLPVRKLVDGERRRLYWMWKSLPKRGEVCRAWRAFEPFRTWALSTGARPGLHLMRKRLGGPFSPGNCEWVTRSEVSRRVAHRRWQRD